LLQTARNLESTHAVNRQAAQSIQNEVVRVSAIETQVTENTNAALAIAEQAKIDADAAYANASTIGSITTDVLSLSLRANQLRDTAQTLNTRVRISTLGTNLDVTR
jgi:chaperonin cofactor prefoldin